MKDDDSLYFSFDDQEEPEEEEDLAQAEEGQNKGFLYGMIALGVLFLLVVCGVVAFVFLRPQLSGLFGGPPQVSGNQLTNEYNMTLYAVTQQAQQLTQAAVPTEALEPALSPSAQASPTPTSEVEVTVIGTETVEGTAEGTAEGTQIAEITPGPGTASATPGAGTQVAEVTSGPGQVTSTPKVSGLVATPTKIQPTSSIIEVTPRGGTGATPTRIIAGLGGTVTPGGTAVATGVGGPFQPTVQPTLPNTGFAGGAGLLGAGFLAIVLVAVVVIVRRVRLH